MLWALEWLPVPRTIGWARLFWTVGRFPSKPQMLDKSPQKKRRPRTIFCELKSKECSRLVIEIFLFWIVICHSCLYLSVWSFRFTISSTSVFNVSLVHLLNADTVAVNFSPTFGPAISLAALNISWIHSLAAWSANNTSGSECCDINRMYKHTSRVHSEVDV